MAVPARAALLGLLVGLAPGLASAQKPPPGTHRGSSDARAGAVMSGFETLADGSTRLFVELSKPVSYETKAARGSITYVLKDARVVRRNNTNPLVTVHFNTPVTSARLVPHGHDLWFVLEMRANVQPAVSMDTAKDGGAVLHVAMPKGDYLPGAPAPAPSGAAPSGEDSKTTAPNPP